MISYKGHHKIFNLPRPPHRREAVATKRGLSKQQVCVPVGVNLNGLAIAKIANLGRPNVADLQKVLQAKRQMLQSVLRYQFNKNLTGN